MYPHDMLIRAPAASDLRKKVTLDPLILLHIHEFRIDCAARCGHCPLNEFLRLARSC